MKSFLLAVFAGLLLPSLAFAETDVITVEGFGTVDPNDPSIVSETQMKFMAKRAATADAYQNLLEYIRGVEVTAGTTVEMMEVTSALVATRVRGTVRGAFETGSEISSEADSFSAMVRLSLCETNNSERCRDKVSVQQLREEIIALAEQARE